LDAAYGAFEENIKGSIEKGKLADLVVFTENIMEAEEMDILKAEVAMTIVDGKVVYKK
jgi:predicted amidohydrolase YtcJ